MSLLLRASDIWILQPQPHELFEAARYAARSLPWTFNRMMLNTSSKGQQQRALNIAKGVLGQQMVARALLSRGANIVFQKKSYRDEDLFDFRVPIRGRHATMDVKSVNYYYDYESRGREPLSESLIITYADYPGPDWRRFFPMLIPHTQINQGKESYCFAIGSSIDFRNDIDTDRPGYAITAFPYGRVLRFFSDRRLCSEREDAGRGIYLGCSWEPTLLWSRAIELTIIGEWDGESVEYRIAIQPGKVAEVGPFSCVSAFQVDRLEFDALDVGQLRIWIARNDLTGPVYNSNHENINVVPTEALTLRRSDFCNLVLPSHYTLYVLGWITKEEFLYRCRRYTGWIWPDSRINEFENQPWSQITTRDREALERTGFEDCIQRTPRLLAAGWMKTNGRGGGACCYVYPNMRGGRGGVRETNLYVLPQDLHPMDELVITQGSEAR